MTATTVPVRSPRVGRSPAGRLLRLELRRNPLPYTLPLLAVLFWYDTYQTTMVFPAAWLQRTMIMQTHAVSDFAPFVVGVAAWTGSRERRRRMIDLVAATSRPRLSARLAAWGATTCWAAVAYLVFTGVIFGLTVRHAVWGGPPWWLVAVGVASMAAFSAVGFTAGTLMPSRFTAPVVALVVFAPLAVAFRLAVDGDPYALIAPVNDTIGHKPPADIGVFYPFLPDLSIAQLMFLAGITAAMLAALGLRSADGARLPRLICAATAMAGLVAAGVAVGLAGTASVAAQGMVEIPALHDAAGDQEIAFTPVCGVAVVPVCLHPAFKDYLPDVTAALGPVLDEVSGLPGAPVRIVQITTDYRVDGGELSPTTGGETIGGNPPVYYLPLANVRVAPGYFSTAFVIGMLRLQAGTTIVDHVVTGLNAIGPRQGDPAQQAVETALLEKVGVGLGVRECSGTGLMSGCVVTWPPSAPIAAAAVRFAALPAVARHRWLLTHMTALRAGTIALDQLP